MEPATPPSRPAWVDALPDTLELVGPLDLELWQWVALPLWLAASLAAGWLIGRVVHLGVKALTARTPSTDDDVVADNLRPPLGVGLGLVVAYASMPLWAPPTGVSAWLTEALKALVVVVFFWVLLRVVDVAARRIVKATWAKTAASRSLVPLGARIVKIAVVALGVVTLFAELGYPIASILAGLGIGGIAVALAAQKTVENLFGAFALGLDQPMRVGDFVKIEDFVGTVEAIGLRSTRVRTLERTLITIPNGRLADMRLESYTARDRLRLFTTVHLVTTTTPEQLRRVIAGFEAAVRAHPKLWTESWTVRLVQLGSASIDLEVNAWFLTTDWSELTAIRQELLLSFVDAVHAAGTSLAVPTRLHVEGRLAPLPADGGERPRA